MKYSINDFLIFNLIMLLISMISLTTRYKYKKYFLYLQVLIVSIFFGIRDISVGTDTQVYVYSYMNEENWLDIGFVILNKLIFFIFRDNWRIYLLIISFLTSFIMAKTYIIIFNKNNYICFAYWALFSMPYMIMMQVNIIRQGLAISLLLLGFFMKFIKYKNRTGYILIFISCIIHYSMFIFTIGFFIFLKLNMKKNFLIFLIIAILSLSFFNISEKIIYMLPSDFYIKNKFSNFLIEKNTIFFFIKFLFYFISYIVTFLMVDKINDKVFCMVYKLTSFLLLSSSFLIQSELIATRFLLSVDAIIPVIYLYPQKIFKNKKVYLFLYIIFMFIYYVFILNSGAFNISIYS